MFLSNRTCLCLQRTFFKKCIEDMAAGSLRCVAIAYLPYEENVPTDERQLADWALPEDELVLLAIVGIKVVPPQVHSYAHGHIDDALLLFES